MIRGKTRVYRGKGEGKHVNVKMYAVPHPGKKKKKFATTKRTPFHY